MPELKGNMRTIQYQGAGDIELRHFGVLMLYSSSRGFSIVPVE